MRLHRYLLKQYMQVTTMVLVSLLMVVWLNQMLQLLELVVNKGSPLGSFFILSLLAMPLWLLQAIPIALFIGVIWVVNKITSDRELVAMQAAGWSIKQFTIAPLFLGALCTAFLILNSTILLPAGFGAYKDKQSELRAAIPKVLLQDKVFVDLAPNLTIFINERVSRTSVRNVFIQDKRNSDAISILTAAKGQFLLDNGQPVLVLEQGERSQINNLGEASATLYFDQYKLNIARTTQSTAQRSVLDMNEDSIANLLNPETSASPRYISQRLAYGHYRITSPFLGITLTLVALAALLRGRLRDEFKRRRMWQAIIAGMVVQILFISARSITVTSPQLWFAQYLVLLLPAAIASYMLLSPETARFKNWQMVKS